MKILMITDKMDIGGAETHILTLIPALTARGHKIVLASSGGSLAKRLSREYGIPHLTLPLGSKKPSDLLFCRSQLSRLIKKERFDLIHSHARLPSLIASGLSKCKKTPLVCTAHARFSAKGFRKRFSRWGDHSIAVSEDLKQYLIDSYSIAPENVSVIPNGIDTELFTPLPRPASPLRIGFLSRLDTDCSLGAKLLCLIAPRLCSSPRDIEIFIGGGGSAFKEISFLAKKANKKLGRECVKVVGRVDDTPAFLASCHIFVGVSRAALEAAASGAKVIICGDEGYFGPLTKENFNFALSSNFCARSQKSPSAERLFSDIISLFDSDTDDLRSLIEERLNVKKTAFLTEKVYKSALTAKKKSRTDLLLCGYYGYGNMGDDALLRSAIARARTSFRSLSVGALTRSGRRDEKIFGIRCVGRYNIFSVLSELRKCGYFIFGGGTLLQSSTSLRSLLYYSTVFHLAKLFGARCYLWANGIGELSSPLARSLAKSVLDKCDHIGLRDNLSMKKARELMPNCAPVFEADLATRLLPSDESRCAYLLSRLFGGFGDPPPFIIVAPRSSDGLGELEKALYRAKKEGYELCFVAMHAVEDRNIALRLCRKFGGCFLRGIGYSDLLGLISYSKGVYSMRLHTLIAARSAGVPHRAFGSDEKLRGYNAY